MPPTFLRLNLPIFAMSLTISNKYTMKNVCHYAEKTEGFIIMSKVLTLWNQLKSSSAGRLLFSKLICWKAPYFSSISPLFDVVKPDYCQVSIHKHRKLMNHINTIHAIVMCNMAELAGGTMTQVSVPNHYRWIPKGMTVEYLQKAETDLVAIATPADPEQHWQAHTEYLVKVEIFDTAQVLVFRALISMRISPQK